MSNILFTLGVIKSELADCHVPDKETASLLNEVVFYFEEACQMDSFDRKVLLKEVKGKLEHLDFPRAAVLRP